MYKKITDVDLKFSGCDDCPKSCCTAEHGYPLAPLILEDFEDTYKRFPILFANINQIFKAVFILHDGISDCQFLDENKKCKIYDSRPASCIMYPISPLFDEIVVDIDCHGVGNSGEFLCNSSGFNKNFHHKRVDGFYEKLSKTQKFLNAIRFHVEYVLTIQDIKLYKYIGEPLKEYEKFLDMHYESLSLAKPHLK